MARPNEEEVHVLREFRKRISDLELTEDQLTDDALLKWLRARNLDLDKSNDMLRKSLEWRKENNIANILSWKPPESFHTEYQFEIYGFTYAGCAIFGADVGTWDFRKAAEDPEKLKVFLKYFDFMLAQVFEKMKKYRDERKRDGRPALPNGSQFIVILDYGTFSFRQLTSFASFSAINSIVTRFEANYPEVLKTCYVLNASWIFLSLFKLLRPFLSGRTLEKVRIFGLNKDDWMTSLLGNMPKDQLPAKYGGTYVENQQN